MHLSTYLLVLSVELFDLSFVGRPLSLDLGQFLRDLQMVLLIEVSYVTLVGHLKVGQLFLERIDSPNHFVMFRSKFLLKSSQLCCVHCIKVLEEEFILVTLVFDLSIVQLVQILEEEFILLSLVM